MQVAVVEVSQTGDEAVRTVAEYQELVGQLQAALERSEVVGQATGILMERLNVGSDEAYEVLRDLSISLKRRVLSVADELVSTGTLPTGVGGGRVIAGTFLL
jgi:AmiR/NasT family two-component response regulator